MRPPWNRRSAATTASQLGRRGLPEPLVLNAQHLAARHGIVALDAYLEFFDCLLAGKALPPTAEVEITALIDSNEQRSQLIDLVKRRIPSVTSFEDAATLNSMLFRLSGVDYTDAAVTEFVHAGMRRTLSERTAGFQDREKYLNYHDARDALFDCKRLFDAAGKRFFLDRGTLLGAVREGGFIASDYDIDVGIFADEITLDEVRDLFRGTSFEITKDFEFKVGVRSDTGIEIDFFLTTRERGFFLSKGFRSIHNWYFTPFDLMEYPFLGERFFIPATFEKHLDENYGNWRDPAIFYGLSYDEPCVSHGSGPEAFLYLSKRLGLAMRNGWRHFASEAANALARSFDIDVRNKIPARMAATVTPLDEPAWVARPVLIIDRFDRYESHQRRVIEAALSITPDVRIGVMSDPAAVDVTNAVAVAAAIGRVNAIEVATLDAGSSALNLAWLIDHNPQAVVISRDLAELMPSTHVASLLDHQCDVAFFSESTISINLVDGRLVSRDAADQVESHR